MIRRLSHPVPVLGLYLVVAVTLTWPLVTDLGGSVVKGTWWWDAYTNTMIMETRVQGLLGQGAGGLYQYYWYAPLHHTMVFNENELVLFLFYLPFRVTGCTPLAAYNLVLLLSLAMGGLGMFLLARRLTRSPPAAFVAGLAFAFCPFVLFELSRIQLAATLFVPLCLLFLHRALARGRWTDWGGLSLAYVGQVGSGMYYAIFLVPMLAVMTGWLALRRKSRVRWPRLAVCAAVTALVVAGMVWPYLAERDAQGLSFDRQYVARTDGELAGLLHVNPENRLWTPLQHRRRGASESSAFTGLIPVLLALCALVGPLLAAGRRAAMRLLLYWSAAALVAGAAAVLTGHGVALLPVVGLLGWVWWRRRSARILPTTTSLYLALLVLAVLLYTGLSWGVVAGREVAGLYDALYAWVPGFQSVRKVQRLALMVMLPLAVLAAVGLTLLLARCRRRWQRAALTVGCSVAVLTELWSTPMPVKEVMAAKQAPEVYRWLRRQPGHGPIAALPARNGARTYVADIGGSLHNYLTIFHRKHTVLGFSTWDSPLCQALTEALDSLPGADPLPLLRTAGVRYLVLHEGDLRPGRLRPVRGFFRRHAVTYREVFRAGQDVVYRVDAPPMALRETPPLPAGHLDELTPSSQQWLDGAVTVQLPRPARVAALEIRYPLGRATLGAPLAFVAQVSDDGARWRTVVEERRPALYRDQVYRPARFVFRVVLPGAPQTRWVRLRSLLPAPVGDAVGRVTLLGRGPAFE